jgi:hypothetical protein
LPTVQGGVGVLREANGYFFTSRCPYKVLMRVSISKANANADYENNNVKQFCAVGYQKQRNVKHNLWWPLLQSGMQATSSAAVCGARCNAFHNCEAFKWSLISKRCTLTRSAFHVTNRNRTCLDRCTSAGFCCEVAGASCALGCHAGSTIKDSAALKLWLRKRAGISGKQLELVVLRCAGRLFFS